MLQPAQIRALAAVVGLQPAHLDVLGLIVSVEAVFAPLSPLQACGLASRQCPRFWTPHNPLRTTAVVVDCVGLRAMDDEFDVSFIPSDLNDRLVRVHHVTLCAAIAKTEHGCGQVVVRPSP